MGVLPDLVAAGTPPVRRTLFHYADGDSVQVSIRPSPGVDALYAPRRHLLDRMLVDAAAAAGAEVHHGVTVTGLLEADDGRVAGVRVSEGTPRAAEPVRRRRRRDPLGRGRRGPGRCRAEGTSAGAVLYRYHAGVDAAGYEWAYGPGTAAG